MNVWRQALVVLLVILFAVGCATGRSEMTSQVNPAHGEREFTRVVVLGNFQSLEYRHEAEIVFCEDLGYMAEGDCLLAHEIFFPAQEYTEEQISERFRELDVDALIVLKPTDRGTFTSHVPQTSYTTTTAAATVNTFSGSNVTQSFNVEQPWGHYEVILYSVPEDQVVWYATAESTGSSHAGSKHLVGSVAEKAVEQLLEDEIFPRKLWWW